MTTDDELQVARKEIARLEHELQVERLMTSVEVEILTRIIAGETTAQIGAGMYLSPDTIKTDLKHMYVKLGVHNRAGAAAAGVRLGL